MMEIVRVSASMRAFQVLVVGIVKALLQLSVLDSPDGDTSNFSLIE